MHGLTTAFTVADLPQVSHLRAERDILKIVDCQFIIKALGFFHDENCVYFVLQCVNGGEFFRHLRSRGR